MISNARAATVFSLHVTLLGIETAINLVYVKNIALSLHVTLLGIETLFSTDHTNNHHLYM